MVIFHSYVSLPEGSWFINPNLPIEDHRRLSPGAWGLLGAIQVVCAGSGSWMGTASRRLEMGCKSSNQMSLYECLYMYIYIYMYMYIYIYVCIYIYMYVYIYICMCIYIYVCVYIYVIMCVCVSICLYMSLYVSICLYMVNVPVFPWMGSVKQSDDPGTAGVEKLEDHRTDRECIDIPADRKSPFFLTATRPGKLSRKTMERSTIL